MFEFNAPIDTNQMQAVATGHAQTMERWEDGPNGRRSSGEPLLDEATGAPVRIYDVMLPTGRDGRHELHGVRIISHEAPELPPYSQVELVGLVAKVRQARNGGKGVDVQFNAESIRPAAPQRGNGRRSAETTAEAA
jgi:hypothetical protein